jgi:hypothetical protein
MGVDGKTKARRRSWYDRWDQRTDSGAQRHRRSVSARAWPIFLPAIPNGDRGVLAPPVILIDAAADDDNGHSVAGSDDINAQHFCPVRATSPGVMEISRRSWGRGATIPLWREAHRWCSGDDGTRSGRRRCHPLRLIAYASVHDRPTLRRPGALLERGEIAGDRSSPSCRPRRTGIGARSRLRARLCCSVR